MENTHAQIPIFIFSQTTHNQRIGILINIVRIAIFTKQLLYFSNYTTYYVNYTIYDASKIAPPAQGWSDLFSGLLELLNEEWF